MVCTSCGAGNNDTAVFCNVCGTTLKSTYTQAQHTYYTNNIAKGYPSKNEWTAYVGMISGIMSIAGMTLMLIIPLITLFSLIFCFVAGVGGIVLGAFGLKTKYKGMAVAGLCCGIAGILLEIVVVIMVGIAVLIFKLFLNRIGL